MTDNPTPREVQIDLNGHKASDEGFHKLVLSFIAAVFAAVVGFAGYQYSNNEAAKAQQAAAQQQQIAAQQAALAAERQSAIDASVLTLRKMGDQPTAQEGTPRQ